MKKKYFGTDGIRGTVNTSNINGEKFFKFGLAAGTYFKNLKKKKQIAIIAKDTRLSDDLIFLSASFKGFKKNSNIIKNEMVKLKKKMATVQMKKL